MGSCTSKNQKVHPESRPLISAPVLTYTSATRHATISVRRSLHCYRDYNYKFPEVPVTESSGVVSSGPHRLAPPPPVWVVKKPKYHHYEEVGEEEKWTIPDAHEPQDVEMKLERYVGSKKVLKELEAEFNDISKNLTEDVENLDQKPSDMELPLVDYHSFHDLETILEEEEPEDNQ